MSALTIVALVLLVLWLLGFFVVHIGSVIHALIVIAVIVFIVDLLRGRSSV
jgi:hypothetical protein